MSHSYPRYWLIIIGHNREYHIVYYTLLQKYWFKQYLFRDNWETIQVLYKSITNASNLTFILFKEVVQKDYVSMIRIICYRN